MRPRAIREAIVSRMSATALIPEKMAAKGQCLRANATSIPLALAFELLNPLC